ncbi:MAG: 3-phosphoshikimate 1-carboxyvinyltransferase [Gemmatimonadaceae bacterium]|nr:3-phosphoshikimate 1-carboxyvinyltransferase [Chitinophagaceae bacterium]
MIVTVTPSILRGNIQAPASKSSMQRACAAALILNGTSVISNPGHSNDDRAAMDIIQKLGAVIKFEDDKLVVQSSGVKPVAESIDCGESGLSIRMFTPIVALSKSTITVTGSGSLGSRPMDFFDQVLPQVGVTVRSAGGRLPLVIEGPIIPQDISIDGSLSSQFLTGLLMAYASAGADGKTISVNGLKSKPYIDLTLKVMESFGLPVPVNHNYESFQFGETVVRNGPEAVHYTVEGDWSGAAFLLVAGAVAGPITVHGLDVFSTQADKAVLQALMSCGAAISVQPEKIEIGPMPLKAFHFNATDCPDLFPPLVALAAFCEGTTVIEGAGRLTHKESNRALTLQEEFGKMGVEISLQDDLMIIRGTKIVKGADVHSHHDHRIAMACAVAGLRAEGEMTIGDADAINKSYPDFYQHLSELGATIVKKVNA